MAKIHRFIGGFDLSTEKVDLNKKELEIGGEIAHQIIKVLKLKIGEKIELCDGKNTSVMAEICKFGKNFVKVKIITPLHQGFAGQNSTKKVNLFCAILKKENFELVVQKTTECGISKIIPIITSRTIKTGLNMERLQKIAKEASEQSGRATVPEIENPIKFEEAIKNLEGEKILFNIDGELLFCEELSYKIPWEVRRHQTEKISSKKFSCILEDNSSQNIFIGPEGGWTPEEIKMAKENNFKIASLGSLTLRGETAAIIATYLVSNMIK